MSNPLDVSLACVQILERVSKQTIENGSGSALSSSLLSATTTLSQLTTDASIVPGSVVVPWGPWCGYNRDEALQFLNTAPLTASSVTASSVKAPSIKLTSVQANEFNAALGSSVSHFAEAANSITK